MVDETNSLEEIRAYFAQDKFAAQAQCSIIEAAPNHAICEMPITENHLNANGTVMGGAMFTLADFTMAIISNMDNKPTVAIDCITVENEYGHTPAQRAELDWLLWNKPLEYAQMVLRGEMEHYLSLGCDHGRLED